jgi:serine protease inhibitor
MIPNSNICSQFLVPSTTAKNIMNSSNSVIFKSTDIVAYNPQSPYANKIQSLFQSLAMRVDKNNVSSIVQKINKSISDNTNNLIIGDVDATLLLNAQIVIINIIYFLGLWNTAFDSKMNIMDIWNGTKSSRVAYMTQRNTSYNYIATPKMQVLEMPYKDPSFVFGVILPMAAVNSLDDTAILTTIGTLKPLIEINYLQIPKFTARYEVPSNEISKVFGLSPMIDCIQKIYIKVDEQGTEAAAVTQVILKNSFNPNERIINFVANKPFIYYIYHVVSKSILFVGHMDMPSN